MDFSAWPWHWRRESAICFRPISNSRVKPRRCMIERFSTWRNGSHQRRCHFIQSWNHFPSNRPFPCRISWPCWKTLSSQHTAQSPMMICTMNCSCLIILYRAFLVRPPLWRSGYNSSMLWNARILRECFRSLQAFLWVILSWNECSPLWRKSGKTIATVSWLKLWKRYLSISSTWSIPAKTSFQSWVKIKICSEPLGKTRSTMPKSVLCVPFLCFSLTFCRFNDFLFQFISIWFQTYIFLDLSFLISKVSVMLDILSLKCSQF